MSDQEPGHGHHVLTEQAVHELFKTQPEGTTLLGLTEGQFSATLDHWQGFADGWFAARAEKGEVFRLPGNTYWPAVVAPGVQGEHALADPTKSAQ